MADILNPSTPLGLAVWILLVLGGTLRLSRLITTDTLGYWLIRGPLERRAELREQAIRQAYREVIDDFVASPEQMETELAQELLHRETQLASPDPITPWARIVSGLSCPFCVGFWIGAGVLVASVILAPLGIVGLIWVVFLATLTLNYIVGHLSARID